MVPDPVGTIRSMRIFGLRRYDLPDVSDRLIHFTGRSGLRINVDDDISGWTAEQRLANLLARGVIRGFTTFGAGGDVVCLTESTKAAVMRLVGEGRYKPCGIGFSKQQVFDANGGPALYVRGDEWKAAIDALEPPLRCRLVRFWPGAESDPGEYPADYLTSTSEWLHEREWRVPTELRFTVDQIGFLVVPRATWQDEFEPWIASVAGDEYAAAVAWIPTVVMDDAGNLLRDDTEIWRRS